MSSGSRRSRAWAAAAALLLAQAAAGASDLAPPWAATVVPAEPPATSTSPVSQAPPATLRVCADPNNLPFSNAREEGFENRIAALIADDLGARVAYVWWPQRRGFLRHTLAAGRCDVVMGLPAGDPGAETTRPYYRSTFVFVTRAAGDPAPRDFDDPRLRTLAIGVPAVGDGATGVPPAQALAARGLSANLRAYALQGDYAQADPPRRLVDAVAEGAVDIGLAWGPLAGYFARREVPPLRVTPVPPSDRGVPMTFGIAMGVRRGDAAARDRLQQAIARQLPRIEAVLREYGVPLVPADVRAAAAAGAGPTGSP